MGSRCSVGALRLGVARAVTVLLRLIHVNSERRRRWQSDLAAKESKMLDTVLLAAGVAFFVLAIAYVAACDRM